MAVFKPVPESVPVGWASETLVTTGPAEVL